MGLISAFLKVTVARKNSTVRTTIPRPRPPHTPGRRSPNEPGSARTPKCHQTLGKTRPGRSPCSAGGLGCRWPALPRGGCRPHPVLVVRGPLAQNQGGGPGSREARVPPRRGSLTVALGPDKQGHALQPLHVAGRHMPGAPIVPLPVLVERVNLHPPPGVGHRAARGPGQRPRRSRPGRGSGVGGSRGGKTPASGGLPGFTATAGRRRAVLPPAWPVPGPELWVPAFSRLRYLGAIVQARRAPRPRRGA